MKKKVLIRTTLNIPEVLDKKIREYGESLGLNYTASVIDLINRGLQQIDTFDAMNILLQESKKVSRRNKDINYREIISHIDM